MIDQSYLQNHLKIGQILRLDSLIKVSAGTICALYPNQPYVAGEVPQSARINAHLKATGYAADESHWALVIAEPETVSVSIFKRSEKLDILAIHEIQSEHKVKLPEGFEPMSCASLGNAAITKIESRNRIFLVIGKTK